MNIHIIVRDVPGERDRVLPRMARLLASATGWTMSGKPNPKADVNYAFPYIDARGIDMRGRPLAGYFTHREDILPAKVAVWNRLAARCALRITSAQQYADELSEHGPTRLIAPPLDRDHFSPGRIRQRQDAGEIAPVAGVSGFTYSGGRKGEALLASLLRTEAGSAFAWRAVGRGWAPLKTQRIEYAELPDWYRSLDLYVCPSLIEGVPYGPLEALACGVPVVIPHGVGLLDELPEMDGIWRYDCGSVVEMQAALTRARLCIMDGQFDRDALRAATERFTEEGWITGHLEAFAEAPWAVSEPVLASPPAGFSSKAAHASATHGIYVVAYGAPARACAERLISTIHAHMPGAQVAVASDEPLPAADINVYYPDADLGGRSAKTKMYELAPAEWKRVLYLDADIELTADVSFLFAALAAGWELVCTKDVDNPDPKASYDTIWALFRRDARERELGMKALGSDRALQLAGGVVGFRRTEATQRFFAAWYEEWHRLARRDQGAMIRALYANPVRLLVLGNEWNSFEGIFKGRSAGVLHHRGGPARRVHRWDQGRLDDPRAFTAGRNGGVGVRKGRRFTTVLTDEPGVGVRVSEVPPSGRTAVVTYTGASRVRRAAGLGRRAYVFHQGQPLRVYVEDISTITSIGAGCWIVEEEPELPASQPVPQRTALAGRGVGVRR